MAIAVDILSDPCVVRRTQHFNVVWWLGAVAAQIRKESDRDVCACRLSIRRLDQRPELARTADAAPQGGDILTSQRPFLTLAAKTRNRG